MPTPSAFNYAIIRIVPMVERGECINVGVVLFCRTQRFLGARIEHNLQRLEAFAPHLDLAEVQQHLAIIPRICTGGATAAPIGQLPLSERFQWLVAPRSTIIQTSAVHVGICTNAEAMLEYLFRILVSVEQSE